MSTLTGPSYRQVVQSRSQARSDLSMTALFLSIYRERGWRGLFQGIEAKLVQTTTNSALIFLGYERILRIVFMLSKLTAARSPEAIY